MRSFPTIKMEAYSSHIFVDNQLIFFQALIFQIKAIEGDVTKNSKKIRKIEIILTHVVRWVPNIDILQTVANKTEIPLICVKPIKPLNH